MNRTTKQMAKMMLRVRRMVIVEPLKERGGRLQGCMNSGLRPENNNANHAI